MEMLSNKKIAGLVATRGTTRVYAMDDGTWLTAQGGTVSWRNNNPGNLKLEYHGSADPTARSNRSKSQALVLAKDAYPGAVDLDQWGNIVFESYEAGREAQKTLLKGRMSHKTVEQLVECYSAPDYSGDTHYARQIAVIHDTAKTEGQDLHGKIIEDMSPEELNALMDGLAQAESWKAGTTRSTPPLTDAQLADVLHSPHRTAAPAAPVHREGDHGEAVGRLQEELGMLGVTSHDGHPIVQDGRFGPRTREAVEAFQRSHALQVDGIVGHATTEALEHATLQQSALAAITLDHHRHPGHPLFQQALACVGRLDAEAGRTPDLSSYNLSGALALAARHEGLERIDRVVLSEDASRVIAVQGEFGSPLLRLADVDVLQGINTPLAQSSAAEWQVRPSPAVRDEPVPVLQVADVRAVAPR